MIVYYYDKSNPKKALSTECDASTFKDVICELINNGFIYLGYSQ